MTLAQILAEANGHATTFQEAQQAYRDVMYRIDRWLSDACDPAKVVRAAGEQSARDTAQEEFRQAWDQHEPATQEAADRYHALLREIYAYRLDAMRTARLTYNAATATAHAKAQRARVIAYSRFSRIAAHLA